jgi:hypothetical protein
MSEVIAGIGLLISGIAVGLIYKLDGLGLKTIETALYHGTGRDSAARG